MYLQIIEQIKNRIAIGDWAQGVKLPSIRELAVSLKVSVITVKRAYQELESEGVIITRQGKGSFVAGIENLGAKIRNQEIDNLLTEALVKSQSLGLGLAELVKRLELLHQLSDSESVGQGKTLDAMGVTDVVEKSHSGKNEISKKDGGKSNDE
ncbi:GntR family transcriptional regulator [Aliikangiella coralliicola]|uniref:GntR family transcriptional regulator n=2 Tax=Aliikangiella coralliicola TaxID=2592383 RepID=A0A545UCN3_9GAMM|nr:GntR family transcriptional regulator [Aliikangiella coralliicola]